MNETPPILSAGFLVIIFVVIIPTQLVHILVEWSERKVEVGWVAGCSVFGHTSSDGWGGACRWMHAPQPGVDGVRCGVAGSHATIIYYQSR